MPDQAACSLSERERSQLSVHSAAEEAHRSIFCTLIPLQRDSTEDCPKIQLEIIKRNLNHESIRPNPLVHISDYQTHRETPACKITKMPENYFPNPTFMVILMAELQLIQL